MEIMFCYCKDHFRIMRWYEKKRTLLRWKLQEIFKSALNQTLKTCYIEVSVPFVIVSVNQQTQECDYHTQGIIVVLVWLSGKTQWRNKSANGSRNVTNRKRHRGHRQRNSVRLRKGRTLLQQTKRMRTEKRRESRREGRVYN